MSWGPLRAPRQQRVTGPPRESGDTPQILISLDTLRHLPDISQAPLVVSEYLWGSLELPGSPWDPYTILGKNYVILDISGYPWGSLGVSGSLWASLGDPELPWENMYNSGHHVSFSNYLAIAFQFGQDT